MNNRITSVSLFKCISIFAIILTHYSQCFSIGYLNNFLSFGQMGCQVFFVLSSFCLCLSQESNSYPYSKYVRKRLFSFYIPWLLAILIFVLIHLTSLFVFKRTLIATSINPTYIVCNVFLVHGLVPKAINSVVLGGWYIGTLVILYLIHPLLFKIYKNRFYRKKELIFILIPFAICLAMIKFLSLCFPSLSIANNDFLYFSFLNQLPCFLIGILLWGAIRNNKTSTLHPLFSLLCLTLSIVLFYCNIPFTFFLLPLVFSFSFFYLFLWSYRFSFRISPLNKFLLNVGDHTLSIYLTHIMSAWLLTNLIKHQLKVFVQNEYALFLIILVPMLVCVLVLASCFGFVSTRFKNIILSQAASNSSSHRKTN